MTRSAPSVGLMEPPKPQENVKQGGGASQTVVAANRHGRSHRGSTGHRHHRLSTPQTFDTTDFRHHKRRPRQPAWLSVMPFAGPQRPMRLAKARRPTSDKGRPLAVAPRSRKWPGKAMPPLHGDRVPHKRGQRLLSRLLLTRRRADVSSTEVRLPPCIIRGCQLK